jgi:phage terminase Nu1 subunit (DNA packaging protein)
MADEPDLIKRTALAADWGLAPRTLDNWRSRGVGPPFVKINGAVRYSRKACAQWLAQQEAGAPSRRGAA